MPKREEPVPWLASQASAHQPYPRKNLYFSGPGMDELFDYCIWQAHVKQHKTVFGRPARTSPAVIADIVARDYLKTMREQGNFESFAAWRTRHIGPQRGKPLLLVLATRNARFPSRSIGRFRKCERMETQFEAL
jgi:hypothetical protein